MKYIIIETYAQNRRYNIRMLNQEMDHIYNTSEVDKATKVNDILRYANFSKTRQIFHVGGPHFHPCRKSTPLDRHFLQSS